MEQDIDLRKHKFRKFIHSFVHSYMCAYHWARLLGLMTKHNIQVSALKTFIYKVRASVHSMGFRSRSDRPWYRLTELGLVVWKVETR